MKKIIYILALLVSIVISNEVRANMPIMSIKVISVSLKDNEHVIQIEPQGEVNIPKKTIIHLQFNPSNADEKKQFDSALEALKAAAVDKNPITVGVMSNKGFNPIKGRPGHYRSRTIQLKNWPLPKDSAIVCFYHSDRYEEAPK
jgi:hypothetical protein